MEIVFPSGTKLQVVGNEIIHSETGEIFYNDATANMPVRLHHPHLTPSQEAIDLGAKFGITDPNDLIYISCGLHSGFPECCVIFFIVMGCNRLDGYRQVWQDDRYPCVPCPHCVLYRKEFAPCEPCNCWD